MGLFYIITLPILAILYIIIIIQNKKLKIENELLLNKHEEYINKINEYKKLNKELQEKIVWYGIEEKLNKE